MNKELRERDLLWCKALVATLGTYEIEKVTAEFNRIRPDKAVEHSVQSDGLMLPSHRMTHKKKVMGSRQGTLGEVLCKSV